LFNKLSELWGGATSISADSIFNGHDHCHLLQSIYFPFEHVQAGTTCTKLQSGFGGFFNL
jgi:hypothetical protein